ncbi:uncharacterized protein LOC131658877 [Vicia villosa]|uniref:uncharacterized protein LOC131658877 n=1 Tax=Vicia villosa TaxID=3911 RepID=UPI00273B5BCF|nr:uncharacterized protein LOC131658877 [Vicia villosa]
MVEWSFLEAVGASGGLLTMWKKDLFNLVFSFKGQGYLGLCVEKNGKLIYFVNVYASCDINRRMESWKRLIEFKMKNEKGAWCIGGDFNSISSLEEIVGKSGRNYRREMSEFNAFIEEMDLVDLPTIGGKFTWFNSNGKAMSRIDRFLLSEDFIDDWKVEGQFIGERDVSDHALIWLKDKSRNWGPKPFRFINSWFDHVDSNSFVKKEWNIIDIKGRGDFCLVEKLRILKKRLAWWNKEIYGWTDLNLEKVGERY